LAVALPVALDLALPVCSIRLRQCVAARTAMPKASIDKDGKALVLPAEVGTTKY